MFRYWNWFNASAVDYYMNHLVLPQAQKPGFDGVFFDGSDGFMRGTWKQATNLGPANRTDDDALHAMVSVHQRVAQLLYDHGKYAIFSEHLHDTTPTQQAYIAETMVDTPYFRFFEGYQPEIGYIEQLLNETQRASQTLPVIVHQPTSPTGPLGDSIAAFLLIRGEYSYYMASAGWLDGGWVWHPEYDVDYGEPVGPARRDGAVYTRNYTNCIVKVNCSAPVVGSRKGDNDAISQEMLPVPPRDDWTCGLFNCTCQGFANYYGTHPGKGFGCAPVIAQTWWKSRDCNAQGDCACCQGPACSLPHAAPCICPASRGNCRGTITMH